MQVLRDKSSLSLVGKKHKIMNGHTQNLVNIDEGGKTGLEGGKNIDPFKFYELYWTLFQDYDKR
jgi:hypothetical protein